MTIQFFKEVTLKDDFEFFGLAPWAGFLNTWALKTIKAGHLLVLAWVLLNVPQDLRLGSRQLILGLNKCFLPASAISRLLQYLKTRPLYSPLDDAPSSLLTAKIDCVFLVSQMEASVVFLFQIS